jgi:hypothetical protein
MQWLLMIFLKKHCCLPTSVIAQSIIEYVFLKGWSYQKWYTLCNRRLKLEVMCVYS